MLLAACSVIPINHSGTYIKQTGLLKIDRGYGADVIRYRPDGKQLAVSGGSNPYVYIYDLKELKRITRFEKFMKGSNGEALSYDGTGKYFVHQGNMVDKSYFGTDYKYYYVVRDVSNSYQVINDKLQPTVDSSSLRYLYPYPSESKIYGAPKSLVLDSPKFYIFTLPEMTITPLAQGHFLIDKFALSPDGRFLVDCEVGDGVDGTRGWNVRYNLRIWKFPEMELINKIEDAFENEPYVLTWSPDGKTLYSCSIIPKITKGSDRDIRKNEVMLWDTATWTVKNRYIRPSGGSKGFSYLPDGKHVVSLGGASNPVLYLENSLDGEIVDSVKLPHSPHVDTLEQNPVNGNKFALGFEDNILLYEIADLPQ